MTGRPPSADGGGPPRSRRIPEATVARLPLYQRILAEVVRSGSSTVSSEELAARAGVNAAKVRKDFSLLGSFGTRGTGYDPAFLLAQIERALGTDRDWPVVIVGIGNLGRALANSSGFSSHGFWVAGLFDVHPAVVGERVGPLVVQHLDDLAKSAATCTPAIGVIAAPATAAQVVADALVVAGVASILNFAPRVLTVPADVLLRYVDLSVELQVMSFHLVRRRRGAEPSNEAPAGAGTGAGTGVGSGPGSGPGAGPGSGAGAGPARGPGSGAAPDLDRPGGSS